MLKWLEALRQRSWDTTTAPDYLDENEASAYTQGFGDCLGEFRVLVQQLMAN